MGLDTHGLIYPNVSVEEVYAHIVKYVDKEAKFHRDSNVSNEFHKDWVIITFTHKNENRNLSCGIFKRYEDDNYDFLGTDHDDWYTWLSLGCWGNSVDLMRSIVSRFGGWVDDNDCDDEPYYPVPVTEYGEPIKIFRVTRKELNERYGGIVLVVD